VPNRLPQGLRYERFQPGPTLAPYVEHFWLVAGPVLTETRREILIPNGRPMIVCCVGEPGWRVSARDGKRVSNVSNIAGIMTEPLVLEQKGRSIYVAAQLHPWGLNGFLPVERLVDGTLTLEKWLGGNAARDLDAAVAEADLGEPAIRVLERALEQRLTMVPTGVISSAVSAIEDSEGLIEVEELARRMMLSYSALYRLFKAQLGIPPKQYIAIHRYYRLVGGLLMGNMEGGLAQLALMQGYYDQAHATKAFRKFTGVNQTQFRTTLNGIAQLMHRD
jgi:AraC-like DNA-binding protein